MSRYPSLSKLLFIMAAVLMSQAPRAHAKDYFVYYGSGASGPGNGISLGHFDTDTGVLTSPQFAAQAEGPSFIALSADGKYLYSVYAVSGQAAAYAIDAKTGALKLLNLQPSGGTGPCHVSLDKTGRFAMFANYRSGSVAVFPIKADGSLGAQVSGDQHAGTSTNPRQTGPFAHFIITDPTNRYALSCDLGTDKIYVYKFDEKTGNITPNDPGFGTIKPGSGPRHLVFSPNGKVVYCLSEIAGTVTAYNWDPAKGTLTEFQSLSTLPADFTGTNTDAEIMLHPNGKFLYASARGHDSIAVFSIDPETSKLTLVQDASTLGKNPRYFSFDPSGKWIIAGNQGSNTAVVFSVDEKTGKLTPHGDPVAAPGPICMVYLPASAAKSGTP